MGTTNKPAVKPVRRSGLAGRWPTRRARKPDKNTRRFDTKKRVSQRGSGVAETVAKTVKRSAKRAAKGTEVVKRALNLNWDMFTKADTLYIKKKYFSKPSTSKDRKGR